MNVRTLLGAVVLVVSTAVVTTTLVSQDPGPDEAEMMKKWMEFATPGEPHAEFAKKAGKWNLEVTHFMAPGAPPMTEKATAEIEMIMGGRYVLERVSGTMGGMPFEGMGIGGYDNLTKKYLGTWIDNMGTSILSMEGTEKHGALHYSGTASDFMKGKQVPTRSVETKIDADHLKMEMYGPGPDGAEYKVMEIHYIRQGAKNAQ